MFELLVVSKICEKCAYPAKLFFSTRASARDLKKYSHTIFLPKTKFPQRIHPGKRALLDDEIIKNNRFDELYNNQRLANKNGEFVLHDGPPYANGVPHMGHAINKVLKDIINRWHLLDGRKVHYVPGWDCHGLPIELKALTAGDSSNLSALDIRKKAKEFAERTVAEQKIVFRSWGVMADWDNPGGCYHTFDRPYVANQLEQFYQLYRKGLVYRKLKPVYWSPAARTALAESELEYNPKHKSTAVTLRLKIQNPPDDWGSDGNIYALIWTTTPWTLPANQAVAYNPDVGYSLVRGGRGDRYVVATALISSLAGLDGCVEPVLHFKGDRLKTLKYRHPLSGTSHSFFPGSHVTSDAGTGLVHTAPAHGHDDFLVGIDHDLPLDCIVDEEGAYTSKAGPGLKGLKVLREGNRKILELVRDDIIHKEEIVHSYPYDWRSKQPVIIRSSLQWFIDTESIKESAIESLKKVKILPTRNVEILMQQIEQRPYWCISRQRAWGVPIPVLYKDEEPILDRDLIEYYKGLVTSEGPDFWWKLSAGELIPEKLRSSMPTNLRKGEDILDIWLDSGLSWSSVLPGKTADIYLEGVDQFTGWFQSSLLTSIALQGKPPFR
ncbi:Isoleucyl-tRNA synthetase [Nesidiocoris tenuis]|uniref:isoleucine--tRNA ligase n=1 Tax=Nesidiocoris tenuis TaxID=355587 RepID=A0ABN7BA42_9HEMI|nr:Isoleucyl-tRNA synthetase [Nesidiocoris tenuis]